MDGREIPIDPAPLVVYDDDHFYMASVLAEKLVRDGHRIAYVTPHPTVAAWTDLTLEQARIIERLNELGISLHTNVRLEERQGFTNTLTGAPVDLPADRLIFVGARLPDDALLTPLNERLGSDRVWASGDCEVPGTIQAAVLSGHRIARLVMGDPNAGRAFRRDIPALS